MKDSVSGCLCFGTAIMTMIDRPLVFAHDVPAVMISRAHLRRLANFLIDRRIPYESRPFQQSFELVRFPNHTTEDVESFLDQLNTRDA